MPKPQQEQHAFTFPEHLGGIAMIVEVFPKTLPEEKSGYSQFWSAANGGLRDGGLRKSEDI